MTVAIAALGFIGRGTTAERIIDVGGQAVSVVGELNGFELDIRHREVEENLETVILTLRRGTKAEPPPLSLNWSQPSHDIAGIWAPDFEASRTLPPDWREIDKHLYSMLTRQAPVLMLFGSDDANRITFAVSDAVNPVVMDARIREEDARVYFSIDLFTERHQALTGYEVEIRFDRRAIPFYAALKDVSDWWADKPGYKPAPVPDLARQPMYSTWYSYHQGIDAESMLAEVRAAKSLGFQAIIVDDGWQTLDSSRGYAFAGDWQPERLAEMRKFTDEVHAHGMKALLWYSVPFIGEKSAAFATLQGKYLEHIPHYGAYVLDPRYPEVRQFLIDHYKRAVGEWGWDGLKLDFIDRFRTQNDTVLAATDGRDFASVYEAVDRLMTDVIGQLRAINPEIVIEFRQHYIGPKLRTYGNMFRAHDSPNLAFVNRGKVVDLRLLAGNTAVHSDMIMWHYDEPVEIAAFQLLYVLYSVPQVSVRLNEIPNDHRDMIRFYIDYWRSNREVLLDGEFEAKAPLLNYTLVSGRSKDKKIVGLYHDQVVDLDAADRTLRAIDVINAKNSDRVIITATEDMGSYDLLIRDSRGVERSRGRIDLDRGIVGFEVPVSGMLSLTR